MAAMRQSIGLTFFGEKMTASTQIAATKASRGTICFMSMAMQK